MKNQEIKRDVIKDNNTGKIYFDTGMIRFFETLLMKNVTITEAQKKYPDIIIID